MEQDLDTEVRAYVELLVEEKTKAGMSPAAAVREARMEVGGVEQVKESVRDVRAGFLLESLLEDLRYSVRTLAKSPGFSVVAVLTLAIGIGATTTTFSIVEGVLLRALPFPEAGRLVAITPDQGYGGPLMFTGASPRDAYEQWRAAHQVFDGAATYLSRNGIYKGRGPAEQVTWSRVSADFFPLLGARALLGRGFVPNDDAPGSASLAVLSYDFWSERLGGDPHVIGTIITLDTTSYTVVGVMRKSFRYPPRVQVWTNLGPALNGPTSAVSPSSFTPGPAGGTQVANLLFWAIARLKPGASALDAQRQLRVLAQRSWATNPGVRAWLPVVTPLRDLLTGPIRPRLLLMLGAVALLLLIACANVAGLVLSRALARQHQLAMRAALGAGRPRLIRASMVETGVIGLVGGALGLLLAAGCVPLLVKFAGAELPAITHVSIDGRVLVGCLGTSLLAGLLAGLIPAWRAARLPPAAVLSSGGQGRTVPSGGQLGGVLLAGQLALTTVLLAGSALLVRSFDRLNRLDPGFDPTHVIVAEVQLPWSGFPRAARVEYVRQALEQVGSMPGVIATAVGTSIPLEGGGPFITSQTEGEAAPELFMINAVTPGYFRALGIPLGRGRSFGSVDPNTIILDSAAAQARFAGENAVGKPFNGVGQKPAVVVGVVGNVRQVLQQPPTGHIYLPYADDPDPHLNVLAVTYGDPAHSVAAVRRALADLNLNVPVGKVEAMTSLMVESLARQRFYSLLVISFGAMALLLAGVGLFGLASYAVSQRTNEFGIRMALGAGRGSVLRLVLAKSFLLAGIGAALGLIGALAATRSLRALLFEVGPLDPMALAGAVILLVVVALVASYLPARRATLIDPVVALRRE